MEHRNPLPTADVIIEVGDRVVLVRRKYPPEGWAIPGGFVETGETVEAAAVREALEETGLSVTLTALLGVYSDPARDPRHHTITTVYVGKATGKPDGGDDAAEARLFGEGDLPSPIAFDHAAILSDYFRFKKTGKRPL
jgi:8-oxo-dGTP diphosphatase